MFTNPAPSRTDDVVEVLTEEQCWNLLDRCELGRLAVVADGAPEIFPVNYVTDGPYVLFRTAPGTKLEKLAESPQVAFEVDEYDDTHAASVILKGVAHRLTVQSEIDAAEELALESWIPTLKYRWVRITATEVSGRRFPRGPEPERYRASRDDRDG
ncbi:pyridoxamine 5'-phosphate oxidase family protein [Microbacterium immunditiarum]|uniref:Nitroimidazol reductase NimA-like FMN-containing flavoprotein (Pyridoxamine 5'-phosphate oxidase superfamily) n=1 Tax=Microbacterium immunditiarum TaxID=337480 RepID=A0A7Y9KJC8_9MICO|nr:pyridoxamine 5'-phosphate oxidase family protein [Microbacterium immunditiarum]NYE21517.1 nitroimidazol reductase NimA-like FMN-containing flavoprotein (pyridoxamine 5'-phosphate oxidase superfamily) [Microbacterium immunditiarum]